MEIDKDLYKEIKDYCELNNLKPRDDIHDLLKRAFMEDKYGKIPPIFTQKEIRESEKKFEKFVEEVGPEKYADIVNECLFGDDGTNNAVSGTPEPLRDTSRDNVSGKMSGKEEKVEQPVSNVEQKPKKRTIKPIK